MVSVIVPNYNHESFLKERLNSIFNQTFQDFEVIILDDASTDGSMTVLSPFRSHPKVSHISCNSINSGSPFRQWQKGIELAKGEWIWIAESDDFCDTIFLETVMNNVNAEIGVCYVQTKDVDASGKVLLDRVNYTNVFVPNIWKKSFIMHGRVFIEKYLNRLNVIPNASAVIFRKSILKKNDFSEDLLSMKKCGDWYFWIKLCQRTQVQFINKTLNSFRHHEGISRLKDSFDKRKLRVDEEKRIRMYMKDYLDLNIKDSYLPMYNRWFSELTKWDLLKIEKFFFSKMPDTSLINYIYYFISFKLKKKLS